MKKLIYLLIVIFFLFGCLEEKEWKKAQKINKIITYEKYISDFPKSKYLQEAEKSIKKLKEKMAADTLMWKISKEKNTKIAYNNYLKKYPEGIFKNQAKIGIEKIEKKEKADLDFWNKTVKSGTIKDYNYYIELMPEGKYTKKAVSKRKKKFIKLLNTEYSEINIFFEVANQFLEQEKYDTIFTFFSETCTINSDEIKEIKRFYNSFTKNNYKIIQPEKNELSKIILDFYVSEIQENKDEIIYIMTITFDNVNEELKIINMEIAMSINCYECT